MAQRGARTLQKSLLAMRLTQSIRAYHAHTGRVHVAQALAESLQTGDRAGGNVAVQSAFGIQPFAKAHHLTQAIDNHELPVRIAGDNQMKAVGAEINGREHLGNGGRWRSCHEGAAWEPGERAGSGQAENEDPQPQVVAAFGLRITNWAPSRPSR